MKKILQLCLFGILVSAQVHAQVNIGADLSFLPRLEHAGAVYRDGGTAQNALSIFQNHGFRVVRLRLWHSPTEPWNGLDSTIAFARRIRQSGLEILLDLHYSDTWTDPSAQTKPAAWQSLTFPILLDSVYAYTNGVIRRLREANALPRYVQLGNEISGGMLWNDGRVGGEWENEAQWNQLSFLLDAGARGVHDSLPEPDRPEIIIHIAEGGDNNLCRWFLDHLVARFSSFDIIGVSYYPWWHGRPENLAANLNDLAVRYQKDVMVVETAYPWTLDNHDSTGNLVGNGSALLPDYPATDMGQAIFLRDVLTIMQQVPQQLGRGLFYWAPDWISVSAYGSAWENCALFDFTANALPAFRVFGEVVPDHVNHTINSDLELRAFPNPFNNQTTLAFSLPLKQSGEIDIYNSIGQRVWRQVISQDNSPAANHYRLIWNGNGLASGTYMVFLTNGIQVHSTALRLIK